MTDHDELSVRIEDAILHHYYLPTKSAISLLEELQNMHASLDLETKYHHADLMEAAEIERERNEWKKRAERAEKELDVCHRRCNAFEQSRDTIWEKLIRSRKFSVSLTHQVEALKGAVRRLNDALETEAKYHSADLKEAVQIERERNVLVEVSRQAGVRRARWHRALVDLLDSLEEIV